MTAGARRDTPDRTADARSGAGPGDVGGFGPREVRALGVREAERWLLDRVAACATDAREDFGRLGLPVRIVVPSGSVRRQLSLRIVQQHGACAGTVVQTLEAFAREILGRAGRAVAVSPLLSVAIERAAASEASLSHLASLDGGFASLPPLVDDLLDAGFEPALVDIVEERLADLDLGHETKARAASALRVAAKASAWVADRHGGHRSQLWVQAREHVERDSAGAFAARSLFLYGFADGTGVQAELLEALLRYRDACWVTSCPPAPGEDAHDGSPQRVGPRFGEAFRTRLASAVRRVDVIPSETPRARIVGVAAPDRSAEVCEVLVRVRRQLDAGMLPESIGIVARDLAGFQLALRRHASRLAIPISGIAARGAPGAARRRIDALLGVLASGSQTRVGPWLTAIERLPRARALSSLARAQLRARCSERGLLWVSTLARLELETLPLGLDRPPRDDAGMSGGDAEFELALEAARRWQRAVETRPPNATVAQYVAWLAHVVDDVLGWESASPAMGHLRTVFHHLAESVPKADEGFEVDAREFFELLRRALDAAGFDALGGMGGGVQVLSVMEARSQSFAQLYVIGMNRGVFPRRIEEDSLFPDALRMRLRSVLPDLPVKQDGFDEERFLFAQLLSASPEVVLSWSETDDTGRASPRSPLVDVVERADAFTCIEMAPPLHSLARLADSELSPDERALLVGLYGQREEFRKAFRAALEDCMDEGADEIEQARLEVLDEQNRVASDGLGPYLGIVGPLAASDVSHDPRVRPPAVTTLENIARCPWQGFLRRLLRVAPVPDALASLPTLDDPRVLGNVVHNALEQLPFSSSRVAEIDCLRWVEAAADAELKREGIALEGFARVLAERALPFVEAALAFDFQESPPAVLEVEWRGVAHVIDAKGESRTVTFKADRVDDVAGAKVLTDYKTGRRFKIAKTPETKREALLSGIRSGVRLQAALYARAAGEGARGRYLFLAPELASVERAFEIEHDAETSNALDEATSVLLAVWDAGVFPPRLRAFSQDKEPSVCLVCDVREACFRGDSGARRRLSVFIEKDVPLDAIAKAARDVLALDVS